MERRTIGERGQIVLPKHLREQFGLKPGKKVIFEVKNNMIILKPEKNPEEIVEEFVNVSRKKLRKKINIEKILEEEYALR
jgi:AbrB family looped-hinge helix DNA binding protein